MSFLFSNPFDDLIEKVTSEALPLGADISLEAFEVADQIKANSVHPKVAIASIKKRLNHKNPNVQIMTLTLLDICVKNSGQHFLVEVASKDFVDNLAGIIRSSFGQNSDLRQKALACLQNWGLAFKSNPALCYMTTVYEAFKQEGQIFPAIDKAATSAAMIDTTTAPEWSDSDVCVRCRTAFTTFVRKHHCRSCGQTFCNDCSSRRMALPKLGITEEVRACEGCYLRQQSPGEIPSSKPPSRSGPTEDILSKEEEELEKAIAASLESAAPSSKKKSSSKKLKKQVSFKDAKPVDEDEEDADLKAAIEASLKESQPASRDFNKRDESIPSYPLSYEPQPIYEDVQAYKTPSFEPSNLAPPKPTQAQPQLQVQQVELLSQREMDNLRLFAELVEKTDADLALRGIHTLNRAQLENTYNSIIGLHPKLNAALKETESKRREYEDLNARLTDAVKHYEKLLQDRLAMGPQGGSYYQSQESYYYPPSQQQHQQQQSGPSVAYQQGPPDHQQPQAGYALPPTPAQSSYGEFYQHRIHELSYAPQHAQGHQGSSGAPPSTGYAAPPSQEHSRAASTDPYYAQYQQPHPGYSHGEYEGGQYAGQQPPQTQGQPYAAAPAPGYIPDQYQTEYQAPHHLQQQPHPSQQQQPPSSAPVQEANLIEL